LADRGEANSSFGNTISMLREGFAVLGEGGFLVGEGVAMIGNAVAPQKNCPPVPGELSFGSSGHAKFFLHYHRALFCER